MHILDNIPTDLPLGEIRRQLHLKKDERWEEVKQLIEEARPLIHSQAVYKVSFIDERLGDTLIIDGVSFKSEILQKNLANVERVFPFVITIGKQLQETAKERDDLVKMYYFDVIANVALSAGRKYLEKRLQATYKLNGMSFMSPGSLPNWPIEQQRPLFSLFGNQETPIGVRLNNSCLMIPAKSVSGVYFPTEVHFSSCQLCDRRNCASRKAAYNQKVVDEFNTAK